jgi:hypothetical protein
MLSAFERADTEAFAVTLVDQCKKQVEFRKRLRPATLRRIVPEWFERCEDDRLNFIVRPRSSSVQLVQLDDLASDVVNKVWPYAFIAIETSPKNFQVWIAVDGGTPETGRRLRRGLGADPGASGAVRLAGSLNYKPKYAPRYPVVRVAAVEMNRPFIPIEELESSGLLAPAVPPPSLLPRVSTEPRPNAWPDYQRCLENAPKSRTHDGPDRSRADFTWCKIALERFRWAQRPERVVDKLFEISEKAQESGREYCVITVRNALRTRLEGSAQRPPQ